MNKDAQFDIGPLAWVKGEIDLALGRALAAIRSAAAGAPDVAALSLVRGQVHQVSGVLLLIGLEGPAQVSAELEALLDTLTQNAADASLVALADRGASSLSTFLEQLLAGQPAHALRLFGVYRDMRQVRRQSEADPVDLYFPPLVPVVAAAERERLLARPVDPVQRRRFIRRERARYGVGLLRWLRERDPQGLLEMSRALAAIGRVERLPAVRGFWKAASALAEAVGESLVTEEGALARLWLRLERQQARAQTGAPVVAERLAREVLFHVARTYPATAALREVQLLFRLAGSVPETYELADADAAALPRLRALKEVVQSAKSAWTRYASGFTPVVAPFCEQAVLLRDRSAGLGRWALSRVAEEMLAVADKFLEVPGPIDDSVALEVATGLLLLEDALLAPEPLSTEFSEQLQTLIDRMRRWREGDDGVLRAPAPILVEVVRRAQNRMAIAQLVAEVQVNLRSVEKALDGFFRDHTRRALLTGVDGLLAQVAGAFRVLGEVSAADRVDESLARVRAFAGTRYLPLLDDFEHVAQVLSAIGAHAEALQHGPADFDQALTPVQRGDADPGVVAASSVEMEMAELQRVTQQRLDAWLDEPADEGRRETLRLTLEAIQQDAAIVSDPDLERRAVQALSLMGRSGATDDKPALEALMRQIAAATEPVPAPSREVEALAESSPEAIDAELLAIYRREAVDVLATIHQARTALHEQPAHAAGLVTLRRAFHTLKGSGRMVGLLDAGETAYAIERLLDHFIEATYPASDALLGVLDAAAHYFDRLFTALAAGQPVDAGLPLRAMADALRQKPLGVSDARDQTRLFRIFIEEATGLVERLSSVTVSLPATRSVSADAQRAAHTMAGIAATAGYPAVSGLAMALEGAMSGVSEPVPVPVQSLFIAAVGVLRDMIELVRGGGEPVAAVTLVTQLLPLAPPTASLYDNPLLEPDEGDDADLAPLDLAPPTLGAGDDGRAQVGLESGERASASEASGRPAAAPEELDLLDAGLLPFLVDEAQELLPRLGAALRAWDYAPHDGEHARALKRALHTLKGSARTAGALRLGAALHDMETLVDAVDSDPASVRQTIEQLLMLYDRASALFDQILQPDLAGFALSGGGIDEAARPAGEGALDAGPTQGAARALAPIPESSLPARDVQVMAPGMVEVSVPVTAGRPQASWSAATDAAASATAPADAAESDDPQQFEVDRIAVLRVRADMVDRLVNAVGEVSIVRSRIDGEVRNLKMALSDLTENVQRLRQQMREIEIQAETQMQSRTLLADDRQFDPLEFDRFTRFQELTRMMAESVNDVGTVQSSIGRVVDEAESALAAQQRLARDLQQDLLRVRMLPVSAVIERMHRVVRQAARETGRQAVMEVRNGQVELDRSVLERLTGPLEHILRNAVVHGIEDVETRRAQGKPDVGRITIDVRSEGNQVGIDIADDGRGLAVDRIKARAVAQGLLPADVDSDDARVAELVFQSGFSTADEVTPLAGRGIGMDIVRADIAAAGGRVALTFERDRGTRVSIDLPLTLIVTQTVLVAAGGGRYVIPASLVEEVRQLRGEELIECRRDGVARAPSGRSVPYFYLPHRLGDPLAALPEAAVASVLFVRAGASGAAIQVDQVIGNQEIVVKNTGPLLARIGGITGATVLGSGEIVLILNPVLLAQRPIEVPTIGVPSPQAAPERPLIMVVDDSLTVRRATERLLDREGFAAESARDGVEALEMARRTVPAVMLVDIEMPRMDGFDLVRHLRADPRLMKVPIIMISSRTADKHQRLALELGVDVFLGKPYREDELVGHLRRLIGRPTPAAQPAAAL